MQWTYNGRVYTKAVENYNTQRLIPCVSPLKEELVVVFNGSIHFPPPNNAAIFNPDGTSRTQIMKPELASDEYRKYKQGLSSQEKDEQFFLQPHLNKQGNLTLWISFNQDWFEIREVNAQTGQVGKCLGASRL